MKSIDEPSSSYQTPAKSASVKCATEGDARASKSGQAPLHTRAREPMLALASALAAQAAQGDRPVGSLAAAAKHGAPSVLTVDCLHVPAHAARIVQLQRGSVVHGLGGIITMLYRKKHGQTRHDHALADASDAKKATTVVADDLTRSSPSESAALLSRSADVHFPFFFLNGRLAMNPLVVSTALAAIACLAVARWRFRAGGIRPDGGLQTTAVDADPLQSLRQLKRVAQLTEGADDLRNAVDAMEQVSMKILDALDLTGELRSGTSRKDKRFEPSVRQALVLSRVEAELGRFSNTISNILGDATVNLLPLARMLRKGGSAPVVALDIGGTLTKIVMLEKAGSGSVGVTPPAREAPEGWDPSDGVRSGSAGAGVAGDDEQSRGRHGSLQGRMKVLLNDKDKARGNSLVLQLYSFPSANISLVIDFLRAKGIKNMAVPATGGGGHKYAALFAEELGVTLQPNDEMRSVITGKKNKIKSPTCTHF